MPFGAVSAVVSVVAAALVFALRWWDRPAPRWARPAALLGGMVLTSIESLGPVDHLTPG
jgi:hypothetical protein